MLSFPVRNGRRRRVMNEEVLSASSTHTALRAMQGDRDDAPDAPRYSDAAGVENHPQVTDFIPRRYRTIALLVAAGMLSTAMLGALHFFAVPIAVAGGLTHTGYFDLAAPGSLASWVAAGVLMVAGVTCVLIYSLRRHRVDDYRGRYRIWLAAAVACVLLSANSVVGAHDAISQTLSHYTGWTALRAGAAWWLALAGLPLAWIALRALLDVRECRLAAMFLTSAVGCYVVAAASFNSFIPTNDNRIATLNTGAAALLADWLLLAAVVSYARYVILDAQGLVPVVRRASKPRESHKAFAAGSTESSGKPAKTSSLFAAAGLARSKPTTAIQPAKSPASTGQWVDGSRTERDRYEDDADDDSPSGDRKLTKSERKQMRKLKSRDRAA